MVRTPAPGKSASGPVTIVLALLAGAVCADATVYLKNGQKVSGRLIESGDSVGVVTGDGLKTFRRDEIERIERDGFSKATPAQRPPEWS